MTQELRARPVVVGVDASQAALRATCFAAEEATRRSVPLRIVHALGVFEGMTAPPEDLDVPGLVNAGVQTLVQAMADSRLSFGERAMVTALRAPVGDFRDWDAVRAWATEIAGSILTPTQTPSVPG